MAKQALTVQNIDGGDFVDKINALIIKASNAVGASDNSKAKAELTIKILIENGDSDDCFRRVTSTVVDKMPAEAKRPTIYPINTINGERVITVDDAQDGSQMKMPGVSNIGEKRAAS